MPERYHATDVDPDLISFIDIRFANIKMVSLHASKFLGVTVDGPKQT